MPTIASRSTTLGLDKEFAVAVAARNRRGDDAAHAPAFRGKERGDVVAHGAMYRRVAYDAFFDRGPRCFELRFDQRHDGRACAEERADRGQNEFQRDEAHVHRGKIRRLGELRGIERADVGLLHRYDLAARGDARVKLAGPDIDGINASCAARRQHLGKAAGRSADIETDSAGYIEM